MIQNVAHHDLCSQPGRGAGVLHEKIRIRRSHRFPQGDFRWLTVGPKEQPELEIVLMEIRPGMVWDEATANQLKEIVRKGVLGADVFDTDDCRKTFEELKRTGVEFLSEPQDRPYGVEAVFKDNSGNWFSLTQHK